VRLHDLSLEPWAPYAKSLCRAGRCQGSRACLACVLAGWKQRRATARIIVQKPTIVPINVVASRPVLRRCDVAMRAADNPILAAAGSLPHRQAAPYLFKPLPGSYIKPWQYAEKVRPHALLGTFRFARSFGRLHPGGGPGSPVCCRAAASGQPAGDHHRPIAPVWSSPVDRTAARQAAAQRDRPAYAAARAAPADDPARRQQLTRLALLPPNQRCGAS
jgi:hypothetical protein